MAGSTPPDERYETEPRGCWLMTKFDGFDDFIDCANIVELNQRMEEAWKGRTRDED